MKKVILLALLMPFTAFGQIVENFEQGNLNNWVQSTDGRWKADTTAAINGRFSLHHIYDNPEAGTDRIGIPVKNLHPSQGTVSWSFLLRHGYDPSSSNNWAVFLMSDVDPAMISVDGGTNGYAIGVNLTGTDDTLRLVKVKGSLLTTVVSCRINWQTTVGISQPLKMSVDRSAEGNWSVSVSALNGNLYGTYRGRDNELFNPLWFGILYRYSSTRDRLLWIDDLAVNGIFHADTEAPVITSGKVTGRNSVKITFNEPPTPGSMVPENFVLNQDEVKPILIERETELSYRIKFSGDLINKTTNVLIVNKICDISGNCALNISVPFNPVWAVPGDVIISEIMADPAPEVSLPGKEYLELTNRTAYAFNLVNWRIKSESQYYIVPEYTIKPGAILILCASADTSLFAEYGEVKGLKQFPTLTDEGKIVCLTDSTGTLIHGVEYSSGWYGGELKSNGGWSLEMIDTKFPFTGEGNWTASSSRKGGTPGKVNSVAAGNPDNSFYGVQNVFPEDSINIRVSFSEPVLCLTDKKSIEAGGKKISDLFPVDPLYREFIIRLSEPLQRGEKYEFTIAGDITDFAGNLPQETGYTFGLPELPEPGDILFNELLFNPFPGDPDYIELFNKSEKVIDASRLQVVSVSDNGNDTSLLYTVSTEKRCILPEAYYAVSSDRKKITGRYFSSDPKNIYQMSDLPSMSDDKGHLVLYNRELDKIDEVIYSEKMHYSLLSSYEGVALEKTDPNLNSLVPVNWHSASEISGWGTPGAPNSVFAELPAVADRIELSSTRITPDNDGNEDLLLIRFNLTGVENVISVHIFDEAGNYIRKIASNLLTGPVASLVWDGTADDITPVRTGIYIVFITLYDETGKALQWKKICTVIRN